MFFFVSLYTFSQWLIFYMKMFFFGTYLRKILLVEVCHNPTVLPVPWGECEGELRGQSQEEDKLIRNPRTVTLSPLFKLFWLRVQHSDVII